MKEHHVVYSEVVRDALKDYLARAATKGRGHTALAILKEIDTKLRDDPRAFGDPLYDLPEGTQTILHRIYPPWSIVFGVHKSKPIVFHTKHLTVSGKCLLTNTDPRASLRLVRLAVLHSSRQGWLIL